MNEMIQLIKERRSVRKYHDRPVDRAILEDLVDCGRLAPSGHNQGGRYFLVLTERELIDKVGTIATWGKFMIGKVPACIVVFGNPDECTTMLEDGSAATENILLAAKAYGLGTCWMAGYGMPYAAEIEAALSAPEGWKLIAIISVGHGEGPSRMSEKSPLASVIRWERF